MSEINLSLEQFLGPFFNAYENVCIRVFSDQKEPEFKGLKMDINLAKVEKYVPVLMEHNEKNRGIFFVVNYGGHEDKDISRINAQFVENDSLPIEEQLRNLMTFPLEPSLIVKTQKSLHAYWLIQGGNVDQFRTVQKRLAAHFSGDKQIINESRVMRLPGFYHRKSDPVMVQCIKFSPEKRYTQEELLKHLPVIEAEEVNDPKRKRTEKIKGIEKVLKQCEFIQHCKENAKELSEHDWYAMITNLAVFEGGEAAIHALSMDHSSYNRLETQGKIVHFESTGTGPMTCKTIAEKGFKCPKLLDGSCNCIAPVSFAFTHQSLDELMSEIDKLTVSDKMTTNLQVAEDFVVRYLFNVKEVMAIPLITSEIKKHFHFEKDNLRILIKTYKAMHRKFTKLKNSFTQLESDVPSWYSQTENGMRFIPGVLAVHMSQDIFAFYGAEEFYLYENGVYRPIKEIYAAKLVRNHLIDQYATLNGINDALGQWKIMIYKPINQLNPNPFVINLKNGLYNVLEEKLKEHSPEYISTVQIKANYDEEAACPLFQKFLSETISDSDIFMLQEILGYLLIPVNKAQKSFVFVGAGDAGKSTLLSVAQEVLIGSENVSNVPWQALGDRFKTAELFGKLANIFADLPSKNIEDNGIFKSITGEDYLTVEKKHKTPFSFKPYARLMFSCNDIPKNYGDRSSAFFRRLLIIRFEKAVPVEKRDPSLKEKLALEADGIFMWALEGLNRLLKNNYQFTVSEGSRTEVEKYRIESNSVLSYVKNECCIQSDRYIESKEIYRRYREYCQEAGLIPVSQIRFNKELIDFIPEIQMKKDTYSRRVILQGVGIL